MMMILFKYFLLEVKICMMKTQSYPDTLSNKGLYFKYVRTPSYKTFGKSHVMGVRLQVDMSGPEKTIRPCLKSCPALKAVHSIYQF